MEIQLNFRTVSEVDNNERWTLSTPLFEDKKNFDIPYVSLLIQHDYSCNKDGESEKPQTLLQFDNGESRLIVTEDEYHEMAQDIVDHEGGTLDSAEERLMFQYATDEYCRTVWGWNPLNKSKEMWKRWQAIKLLVTPHVTM